MAEHQKSKVNHREEAKKARAREAAEEMMAKQEAEEAGEDYERSQFWNYSAESVERWNEKQEAKRIRMDNKFTGITFIIFIGSYIHLTYEGCKLLTSVVVNYQFKQCVLDWGQMNHKKYLKQVGELKPNLAAYNAKKEAAMHVNEDGELVVASDSGFYRDANSVAFLSDAKPNALAVDRLAADVAKQIEARSKFSKRRAHKEDEDVNYINDANQRFNQKIARFYDKHTKEIRDDFERGTAL
jgi:pre-mRNA-splicing factor SYF2